MQSFVLQDGPSQLYITCYNGHLDVVKTLIEAGANINLANEVSIRMYDDIACDQSSICVHVTKATQLEGNGV